LGLVSVGTGYARHVGPTNTHIQAFANLKILLAIEHEAKESVEFFLVYA